MLYQKHKRCVISYLPANTWREVLHNESVLSSHRRAVSETKGKIAVNTGACVIKKGAQKKVLSSQCNIFNHSKLSFTVFIDAVFTLPAWGMSQYLNLTLRWNNRLSFANRVQQWFDLTQSFTKDFNQIVLMSIFCHMLAIIYLLRKHQSVLRLKTVNL